MRISFSYPLSLAFYYQQGKKGKVSDYLFWSLQKVGIMLNLRAYYSLVVSFFFHYKLNTFLHIDVDCLESKAYHIYTLKLYSEHKQVTQCVRQAS